MVVPPWRLPARKPLRRTTLQLRGRETVGCRLSGRLYAAMLAKGCETPALLERTVQSDPLHVVERDDALADRPVAEGKIEEPVAEDPEFADEIAHAGAAVRVRFESAKLQHFAGAFGHSFVAADLLAYLSHPIALPTCIERK